MAEWRLLRGWRNDALAERFAQLAAVRARQDVVEEEMTSATGWHHYFSESVIARASGPDDSFKRARTALDSYQFSDPSIVLAHFDQAAPLSQRVILLEIKVLGLHYLCPVLVTKVRDEAEVYGFRYDTLEGHIERGVEWFLLSKNDAGEIRFRIEARWRQGELPNWWTRLGFRLLSGHYQRKWHRRAHYRMSLFAHLGSTSSPPAGASTRQLRRPDVTFTYHAKEKAPMTAAALRETLILGAITGMRSMAGPAIVAQGHGRSLPLAMKTLAAGEMVADKTPFVGNRIEPLPLSGRALMGLFVGFVIAREHGGNVLAGGFLGAAAAIAAAHLAYQGRRRLPLPSALTGVAEDAIVVGVGRWYAQRHAST